MAVTFEEFPLESQCGGKKWVIENEEVLADLVANVLIGKALHINEILQNSLTAFVSITNKIREQHKQKLYADLNPDPTKEVKIFHRDGLLFEIICWICINRCLVEGELVSYPHLSSTRQGIDTLKISLEPQTFMVKTVTVCEQKCTGEPRDKFRDEVLPAFKVWLDGKRNGELTQDTSALMRGSGGTFDADQFYDHLIVNRPFVMQAYLTVLPEHHEPRRYNDLLKGFSALPGTSEWKFVDTMAFPQLRPWFQQFALKVWAKIESYEVVD
jgi:hypothetical protein